MMAQGTVLADEDMMTPREAKRLALVLLVRGARSDVREGRGALGAPYRVRKDDLTDRDLDQVRLEAEKILEVLSRRADRLRSFGPASSRRGG